MSEPIISMNLEALAEQRIQEALQRGDLDNLPGSGKPLDLDEEPLVPPDVRALYRVLKNAGFVPPEIEERRAVTELEGRIPQILNPDERARALQKLALLRLSLGIERTKILQRQREYAQKILNKLSR